MSKKVYILTISIGTVLWVLDALFGWLSMLIGGFPGLILVSIIVGMLAANWKDGVISILIINVLGVVIAGVLAFYIFPDWDSVVADNPFTSIILMILYPFVNGYSVAVYHEYYYYLLNNNPDLISNDPFIQGIFSMTPIYYLTSLVIAAIGGLVGNRLKPYLESRFSSSSGVAKTVPSAPGNPPDSQDSADQ